MEYRWIESIEEFKGIADEWDMLVVSGGSQNPFLLSDFIMTWWKYFGKGTSAELRIFALYDDGRIIGGIPLYAEKKSTGPLRLNVLRYVGDAAANYTQPLYGNPGAPVFSLLEEAIAGRNEIDALSLPNACGESAILSEHRHLSGGKGLIHYAVQDHYNYAIDLSSGKEAYFTLLSSELKSDLRQKRKRANREYGELKLRKSCNKRESAEYVEFYMKNSVHAFRSRERRNMVEDERYRSFFSELFAIMDDNGRLDAFALYAGTKMIAVMLGYRFGKGFNWVLTGFDYNFKSIRPGYLLMEEIVYEALRQGEVSCNCYGHESLYKSQWCNKLTPMYRLFAAKRSIKGLLYIFTQRMIGILRTSRTVAAAARKLKGA